MQLAAADETQRLFVAAACKRISKKRDNRFWNVDHSAMIAEHSAPRNCVKKRASKYALKRQFGERDGVREAEVGEHFGVDFAENADRLAAHRELAARPATNVGCSIAAYSAFQPSSRNSASTTLRAVA